MTDSSRDLLLALLVGEPDLNILADPESWGLVKEHSIKHGVAPMIAYLVRPHMPAQERGWCDRILTASWNSHLRNIRGLEYALGIFESAKIDTIVLKGPILANRYYTPPFLRKPSVDIDLIVRDKDLERACEALSRAGYRTYWPVRESRARSHHVRMTHPARISIELHFRLSDPPYAVAVDEFFTRAVPYETPGGCATRLLSPADEIFHLVLHNAQHRFASLFHFSELRRIWNAAAPAIREQTISRAVSHHFAGVFAFTEIAFRTAWREPFLSDDAALPGTWLRWRINERLYRAMTMLSEDYALPAATRRRWVDFQLTDRPADAARFAGRLFHLGCYRLGRWLEGRKGA